MNKNLRTRGIVIGVVTFLSLVLLFGPWNKQQAVKASDFLKFKQNLAENIKLGLDLKGGTHLVMQVQTEEALAALTEGNRQKATEILKKENIPFKDVKVVATGQLEVVTENTNDHEKIKDKLISDFSIDWDTTTSTNPAKVVFTLKTSAADVLRKQATEQARPSLSSGSISLA
jgi:preprotein translocase subunit SecD